MLRLQHKLTHRKWIEYSRKSMAWLAYLLVLFIYLFIDLMCIAVLFASLKPTNGCSNTYALAHTRVHKYTDVNTLIAKSSPFAQYSILMEVGLDWFRNRRIFCFVLMLGGESQKKMRDNKLCDKRNRAVLLLPAHWLKHIHTRMTHSIFVLYLLYLSEYSFVVFVIFYI